MKINDSENQISLFDRDGWSGRTSQAHFQAERKKERTSGLSWRKLSELKYRPFMYLDLTPGHGNLLGVYEWEILSPWLGESSMLNTGPAPPNDVVVSSLWQILQVSVLPKYYLSRTACLGILRRAKERGKALPEQLEIALKLQAGLASCQILRDELKAYHINQRDEGIDLHGVSGALMATSNQQMQTFVTGTPMAFAENQRNEVRDLHAVAGALPAKAGMKQQTFVAAFSAGAGAKAGGISYSEQAAPTLKSAPSGNSMPTVLCLNDQGGQVMDCTENVAGTLRAQEHGHQPMVFENHGIDARYTGLHDVAPTLSARAGTGGNNLPLVQEEVYCITGNAIDREPENGGNGLGIQEDVAYTLTATDHHAVFARQRVDVFQESDVVSTESARQHKDATDLIIQTVPESELILPEDTPKLIRRLTPLECERLQGFPDGWTDIPGASDSARYKALGNSVAIPCVEFILQGIAMAVACA